MRRIFCIFLCFCMVIPPVFAAEEVKYVALTFDDGPSGRYTRRLLDGLRERDVKATFFLCGYRLQEYPKEAQRIFAEGHEIGLHGYSHENMGQMTYGQAKKELQETLALLPKGCDPAFLRPPGGGRCDPELVSRSQGLGKSRCGNRNRSCDAGGAGWGYHSAARYVRLLSNGGAADH